MLIYQVLDTSDLPGGVINNRDGPPRRAGKILAQRDEVATVWFVGSKETSEAIEREFAGNLKATWRAASILRRNR